MGDSSPATTNSSEEAESYCLADLSSFDITNEHRPMKCIKEGCGKLLCAQCIEKIRIYDGTDRDYRCMWCLARYSEGELLQIDQGVYKHLLKEANINYGHERTKLLLETNCDVKDLKDDISLRARQLRNLVSRGNVYQSDPELENLLNEATDMMNKLLALEERLSNVPADLMNCKQEYKNIIAKSQENDHLIMNYVNICEKLRSALAIAEQKRLFSKTYELEKQWSHRQGFGTDFEPKIPKLFDAIKKDLEEIRKDSTKLRVRIGLIGYTSVGKSTVGNRLLGVKSLNEADAAVISMKKSTFFPSEFDSNNPWIDESCDPHRHIPFTIVDIQGLDENRLGNNTERKAGSYVEEIVRADCDIYLIIFDKEISEEQRKWIQFIEVELKRKCVLVRSKIDDVFLKTFKNKTGKYYPCVGDRQERNKEAGSIIRQLRNENAVDSRKVFLVAYSYSWDFSEAEKLAQEQSFDNEELSKELVRIANERHASRLHLLTFRTLSHMINTCFRRGCILKVLWYHLVDSIIPPLKVLKRVPRDHAEEKIRAAFGINQEFLSQIKMLKLVIYDDNLQTSILKSCIKIERSDRTRSDISRWAVAFGYLKRLPRSKFHLNPFSTIPIKTHIFDYISRLSNDLIKIGHEFLKPSCGVENRMD